jgi:choline dehydrogenase-like flavoprotein
MKPTSFGLLPAETEVLVLGADLAGAVAASRLARAGKRVVVLERRTVAEHPGQNGSALEPPPGLFEDPRWPAGLRQHGKDGQHGVAAALAEVRVEASALAGSPEETTAPGGSPVHRLAARHLAVAADHGARLFLGVEARSLEPAGSGWLVKLEIPGLGRERFDAPAMFVAARAVVLSGGAWAGELLAVAHEHGLSLSPLLGVSRSAAMGEAAANAAVDHLGRVFQGDGSAQASLIVAGEASAPMALRPLPGLASAALALRAAEALLAQLGGPGTAAASRVTVASAHDPADTVGMRFTECMRGFFSTQVTEPDYARGATQGREDGSSLAFVVTVVADDLATLVDAPEHRGRLLGTVVAPALSPRPMMVNEGEFDLFGEPAPAQTGEGYSRDRTGLQPRRERHMRYRMPVRAADGQRFFLSGYKVIRDDRGFDVWADTTTLMVTVHAGDDAKAPVIGRGILRIYAEDLKKQVKTMEVTGTRSARQRLRAQLAFARVFGGTLFDAYLGEQHLLPSLGARRGPLWVAMAAAAKALAILIIAGLFLWPWRPAFLRQEPAIAADAADPVQGGPNEPDGPVGRDLPAAVAALGLFPQYLRGRDLRAGLRFERHDFRADWREDNIVTDHGALADLPVRPPDISKLTDGPLRRGYMNLARIRDRNGQVVGIGSQVETASWDSRPWRNLINANTTWSLVLPGRGLLFLSQKEGGDDIGGTSAAAKKAGQTWRGTKRFNHTLGPLSEGRGIIHGGSGAFVPVIGSFREWNTLFEVPVQGIIHGATDFELHLLWTRRAADADARVQARLPAEVAALALPPAALERLHPARPWKVFTRRFVVDLPEDVIYRTHGAGGQGPVVPASLGPLADPALEPVTVFMGKLRDERGDIVGQAGAARIDGPAGPADVDGAVPPGPDGVQLPGAAQWTLLLPGEGSLFVLLPEDQVSRMRPGEPQADGGTRFFGGGRGVVIGGTGLYANAAGLLTERWRPAAPGETAAEGVGSIQLDLRLVLDR